MFHYLKVIKTNRLKEQKSVNNWLSSFQSFNHTFHFLLVYTSSQVLVQFSFPGTLEQIEQQGVFNTIIVIIIIIIIIIMIQAQKQH